MFSYTQKALMVYSCMMPPMEGFPIIQCLTGIMVIIVLMLSRQVDAATNPVVYSLSQLF